VEEHGATYQCVPIRTGEILSEAKELIAPQYWMLFGISAVGMLIASIVPLGILTGPMLCGIYLSLFAAMRGESVRFETLFRGFDFFVESLIATLILIGVMMVVIIPAYVLLFVAGFAMGMAEGQGGGGGVAPMLFVLGMLVFVVLVFAFSLFVCAVTVFTYPLIVDRGLKAIPALKTSYRAVMANFGGVLVLVIVLGLLSFVASLLCYLPVFLVMPLAFASIAVAYRKVFG